MTFGFSAIRRQLNTTPPTGVNALSISAAEVPSAKFFAITIYGPANPLIDVLCAGFEEPMILNWLLSAGEEADPFNALFSRSLRLSRAADLGPRGGTIRPRIEDEGASDKGLFKECRSCVQSAFTLPADGLLAAARGLVEVEMLRYRLLDLVALFNADASHTFVTPAAPILLKSDGVAALDL